MEEGGNGGRLKTGPLIVGVRKWAILRVGFPPVDETMSSSLISTMVSDGSSIFVEQERES